MHLYEKARGKRTGLLLAAAVFLALILLFYFAFGAMNAKSEAEEEKLVLSAIRRGIVTCYAIEGRYPASLDELCARCGIVYDKTRYAVSYDVFAPNVPPSVSVRLIGGEG